MDKSEIEKNKREMKERIKKENILYAKRNGIKFKTIEDVFEQCIDYKSLPEYQGLDGESSYVEVGTVKMLLGDTKEILEAGEIFYCKFFSREGKYVVGSKEEYDHELTYWLENYFWGMGSWDRSGNLKKALLEDDNFEEIKEK